MGWRNRLGVAPATWIVLTVVTVALAPPVFQLLREGDRLFTDPYFNVTATLLSKDWLGRVAEVVRGSVIGPALVALILGFVPAMLIALPAALAISAGLLVASPRIVPCRWRMTWAALGWITGFLAGPPALSMLGQSVPHLPDDAAAGALCATLLHYLLHKQGAFGRRAA